MENGIMNHSNPINDTVVFELPGIDKKWVRSKDNQWVELKEEDAQIDRLLASEDIVVKPRKKWMFWKKA